MKISALSLLMLISINLFACTGNHKELVEPDIPTSDTMNLRIIVGQSVFTATLYDNATATAFKTMLPLTINMSELNGNEKLYNFPNNLPSNASNPGSIQNGDIMLYGSRTLVLFYKSFSTPYSYTRIGKVDNPTGLAAALGSGSVTVRFEVE